MNSVTLLEQFVKEAARKQRAALQEGGWGHAIWCNMQTEKVAKCNCGIADVMMALKAFEKNEEEQKTAEAKRKAAETAPDDLVELISNLNERWPEYKWAANPESRGNGRFDITGAPLCVTWTQKLWDDLKKYHADLDLVKEIHWAATF